MLRASSRAAALALAIAGCAKPSATPRPSPPSPTQPAAIGQHDPTVLPPDIAAWMPADAVEDGRALSMNLDGRG